MDEQDILENTMTLYVFIVFKCAVVLYSQVMVTSSQGDRLINNVVQHYSVLDVILSL